MARHAPVTQRLFKSHVTVTAEGIHRNPAVTRYAWLSELDLMARIAGLRLRDRWAGWEQEPFTAIRRAHVTVHGQWAAAREPEVCARQLAQLGYVA